MKLNPKYDLSTRYRNADDLMITTRPAGHRPPVPPASGNEPTHQHGLRGPLRLRGERGTKTSENLRPLWALRSFIIHRAPVSPRCLGMVVAAMTLLLAHTSPAQIYRPERAQRSVSTEQHELVIQKNSQIDLLTVNGEPLIDNAFPSILFEGGKEVPLDIDFRETSRYSVNSPMGKGNGFVYSSGECEWRIATFPTEAWLTFDLTYTNRSKKPVRVAAIIPLSTGAKGKGGVYMTAGSDTKVLHPASQRDNFAQIVGQAEASPGHLAAWAPSTGRSMIAGFLTHRQSLGTLTLSRSGQSNSGVFDRFVAACIYESPVTVEPGAQLSAETLYLSIGQLDPRVALEAFVKASLAVEPFPTRANLSGWMPQTPDETSVPNFLDNLAAARGRMIPTGWTNWNLGDAWSTPVDSMIPDPQRFPEGFAPLAATLKSQGVKSITMTKQIKGDLNSLIQDINASYLSNSDTIELILPISKQNILLPRPSPVEVLEAIEAASIHQPKIVFGRSVRGGQFSLMDWAMASRSYYLPSIGNPMLAPYLQDLAQDTSHFSDDQFITAFTLAAIEGLPLRPATPWTALSPLRQHILSRLLPAPANSGHPLDLFQDGPPRQWVLPIHTKAGDWNIVALFNWDVKAPLELDTPLPALGLNNDNYYTVYDFWAGQYLGLIERRLRVEVPPEGVRLLGMRHYENHPMLVASSRHYTQGASDHTALDWNHETRTLAGTYTGVAGETCTLSILVPDPYVVSSATSSVEVVGRKQTGSLLELTIRAPASDAVQWKVTF